jgi:probable RNA-binding protein EIF1AD
LPPPHYSLIISAMSGLGRRTHYRKHLTDAVLNDLPEPKDYERIAKVVATRGGNQFDIIVALEKTQTQLVQVQLRVQAVGEQAPPRTPQLAILPTKFHKLVWIKRKDYVIVKTGDQEEDKEDTTDNNSNKKDDGGIRFIISHILYKDQVKHLQSKGLWPEEDPEFSTGRVRDGGDDDDEGEEDSPDEDDGIVYNTGYDDDTDNDDDLFVNTNRVKKISIQDSSEEDSDDD